jgi:hypothetical protein
MPLASTFATFAGATTSIDLDNEDGDEVADLVVLDTDVVVPEEGD